MIYVYRDLSDVCNKKVWLELCKKHDVRTPLLILKYYLPVVVLGLYWYFVPGTCFHIFTGVRQIFVLQKKTSLLCSLRLAAAAAAAAAALPRMVPLGLAPPCLLLLRFSQCAGKVHTYVPY